MSKSILQEIAAYNAQQLDYSQMKHTLLDLFTTNEEYYTRVLQKNVSNMNLYASKISNALNESKSLIIDAQTKNSITNLHIDTLEDAMSTEFAMIYKSLGELKRISKRNDNQILNSIDFVKLKKLEDISGPTKEPIYDAENNLIGYTEPELDEKLRDWIYIIDSKIKYLGKNIISYADTIKIGEDETVQVSDLITKNITADGKLSIVSDSDESIICNKNIKTETNIIANQLDIESDIKSGANIISANDMISHGNISSDKDINSKGSLDIEGSGHIHDGLTIDINGINCQEGDLVTENGKVKCSQGFFSKSGKIVIGEENPTFDFGNGDLRISNAYTGNSIEVLTLMVQQNSTLKGNTYFGDAVGNEQYPASINKTGDLTCFRGTFNSQLYVKETGTFDDLLTLNNGLYISDGLLNSKTVLVNDKFTIGQDCICENVDAWSLNGYVADVEDIPHTVALRDDNGRVKMKSLFLTEENSAVESIIPLNTHIMFRDVNDNLVKYMNQDTLKQFAGIDPLLDAKIMALQNDVSQNKTDITDLQNDVSNIDDLRASVQSNTIDIATLRVDVDRNTGLTAYINSMLNELSSQHSDISDLDTRVTTLETNSSSGSSDDDLEDQVNSNTSSINSILSELASQNADISNLQLTHTQGSGDAYGNSINNYQILKSGDLIIQSMHLYLDGDHVASNGDQLGVIFPQVFPNACVTVQAIGTYSYDDGSTIHRTVTPRVLMRKDNVNTNNIGITFGKTEVLFDLDLVNNGYDNPDVEFFVLAIGY